MTLPTVNPIGPFKDYCDGYGQPGAKGLGYVSTMKLATGLADVSNYKGDFVLEDIVAYDKAEKANAYIGQINMGTASSFCGPMGRLWGYDLAVAPNLTAKELFSAKQYDGSTLPVYSADPLLAATQELFGVEAKRRFPPLPGAYVVCANKSETSAQGSGVGSIWCYIAISITNDRENSADLFIEDAGTSPLTDDGQLNQWLASHAVEVVNSIVACGQDQSVTYKETFISWLGVVVPQGYVGTALTCAPYVTLAEDAVVVDFENMIGMSLSDWSAKAGPGVGAS